MPPHKFIRTFCRSIGELNELEYTEKWEFVPDEVWDVLCEIDSRYSAVRVLYL